MVVVVIVVVDYQQLPTEINQHMRWASLSRKERWHLLLLVYSVRSKQSESTHRVSLHIYTYS
jgi:hypothetical protein